MHFSALAHETRLLDLRVPMADEVMSRHFTPCLVSPERVYTSLFSRAFYRAAFAGAGTGARLRCKHMRLRSVRQHANPSRGLACTVISVRVLKIATVQERVVVKLREWMETGVPEYGLLSFGEIQELQNAARCGRHYLQTAMQQVFAFLCFI